MYKVTHLGKQIRHDSDIDASILNPIARADARRSLLMDYVPFSGTDFWTAYELAWLDQDGMPKLAIADISVPCESKNIIESKSMKLYLNSFYKKKIENRQAVAEKIQFELSEAIGGVVTVKLFTLDAFRKGHPIKTQEGICLDNQRVEPIIFGPAPKILRTMGHKQISETLFSHLLRTICPVTSQPDWASIYVMYRGHSIDRDALFRYIISYREHSDFHEHCVERIFCDILNYCNPTELTVWARFLRRGGLDINPYRTNSGTYPPRIRETRQ
ncbi:MAG: NADPH-dependent 7-cyano-7-deazaguanine reductase QueF [Cellvibrionales bacterium TMED49]|nr:NADPH-dependent 7-cyano-7-deazaguanine reductase QueF [Porticoccaceae bacterium]OUU37690.1 MAG: NADPH-dependent 7-cyano-7-deazaguanine reductase QueF [Cellvibrionales bacterium TMED49]|tara:strand:+ start:907 stop:1722 length:816 start_codon:yes stop_codon:yes gene_type:complete